MPFILVLDELPYLLEDSSFASILQSAWEKLQHQPILLILIGADESVMENLDKYDKELHGRINSFITIREFNLKQISEISGLKNNNSILDIYLTIGGYPLLAKEISSTNFHDYIYEIFSDESHLILNYARTILNAELPNNHKAYTLLKLIAKETQYNTIKTLSGLGNEEYSKLLNYLIEKRLVKKELSLANKPSKLSKYFIDNYYLNFYFNFIEPNLELVQRGKGELVASKVLTQFNTYRGLTIEPLLREIVYNDLLNKGIIAGDYGTFFNRNHSMEIDLVIKDKNILVLGSFKWRDTTKFKQSDKEKLIEATNSQYFKSNISKDIMLIGVSKAGFDKNVVLDYKYEHKDIILALMK